MKQGELNIIEMSEKSMIEKFNTVKSANEHDRLTITDLEALLEVCRQFQDTAHSLFWMNVGFDQVKTIYCPKVNVVTFPEIEHRIEGVRSHLAKLHVTNLDNTRMSKWMLTLLKRLGNLVGAIECFIENFDSRTDASNQEIDHDSDPIDEAFGRLARKLMDATGAAFDAQTIATEYLDRVAKTKPHPAAEPSAATVPDFSHRVFSCEMSNLDIAETITNMASRARAVLDLARSNLGDGRLDADRLYFSLMTVSLDVKDMAAVMEIFEKNQKPIDKEFIDCLPYYAIDLTIFPFLQEICQRALGRLNKIMTLLAENEGRRLVPERICQIIDKIEMEIIRIDQAVPILYEISAAAEQATKTKNKKQPA
jgi:hypothetical protein